MNIVQADKLSKKEGVIWQRKEKKQQRRKHHARKHQKENKNLTVYYIKNPLEEIPKGFLFKFT